MKAKLLLLTATLSIVSCNQKPKEQEVQKQEQVTPKALTEAEKKEMEIQDSLKQVTTDSLALIAWGDVKFGITMKQALSTETFKKGYRIDDWVTMNIEKSLKFAAVTGLENLDGIRSIFKENELTRIVIESYGRPANKIDNLLKDCDIFINNFKEKYGNPSFVKDKVNISDFDNAREIEYAKFQIGTKTITILLINDPLNYLYRYYIYIDNSQFPKKKAIPTEQEKREKEKYRKELKAIKENSF